MSHVESAVAAALVRVSDDGLTRGTGFLISPDVVLTCHHVVAGLRQPMLEAQTGARARAEVESGRDLRQLDLALLRCNGLEGEPLPLATDFGRPLAFWTKGFQYAGEQIRNALPVEGMVTGTTDVTYGAEGEYTIDGALVLSGAEIDHGLSGAPVVDAKWGVAVGVVNTTFRAGSKISGFALPFAAARRAATIDEALAINQAIVPAFGPYLNNIAGVSICRRSVDRCLRRLKTSTQLVLEHYCARSLVASHLDEFVDGEAQVFPLVGPSGVGKTTELAQLAQRRVATLLIPATALGRAPAEDGIAGVLEQELRSTAGLDLPKEDALRALVEALDGKPRLLVLLDALNEAPTELRANFNQWIGATVEWLEDTGSKLVLTSRPEYWAGVKSFLPIELLAVKAAENLEERSVPIGDFTDEEAAAALSAYGLADTGLGVADIRHPFLARIYWEMRREHPGNTRPLSRVDALARYVQLRVRQLAHTTAVAAPAIERVLEDAARDLSRSSLTVERERVAELAATSESVVAGLIASSILVETPDRRYRFAFDEVAEFLRVRHVDLDDLASNEFLDTCADGTFELPYGTVILAFLEFERTRGSAAFVDLLSELLARRRGESTFLLDLLLAEICADAADPNAAFPLCQRFAEAAVADSQPHGAFAIERVLPRIRLSLDRRYELQRILARGERGYDWETGHWDYPRSGFGHWLVADARTHAPETFRLLLAWLDDDAQLVNGFATVADVARGLIYLSAEAGFDELLELLADETELLPTGYGRMIAEAHPERMLEVCERWAQDPERQELAAKLGSAIVGAASVRERILQSLLGLLEAEDAAARDIATRELQFVPEMRPRVLEQVLARYRAGDPSVDATMVAAALPSDFERAFAALRAELDSGSTERRRDVLNQLRSYRTTDVEEAARVLDAVEASWSPTDELAWMVALAVEYRLYALVDTPQLAPRVLALARRIIVEGNDDARESLRLFALGAPPRSEAQADLKRDVFEALLAAADNGRDLGLLLDLAVQKGQEWALDAILARGAIDPQRFERAIVECAWRYNEQARPVLTRLAEGRPYTPSAIALRLLKLVADGGSLQEAADVMVDEGVFKKV